jgi:HEAT repeat protein
VRKVAVTAVAEFDGALVFDDLIVALSDNNWQVRREAVIALGRFSGQAAEAALRDTLGDSAWQVAREAALSLSRLHAGGDERLAGLLLHELGDLRIAAAVALGAVSVEIVRQNRNSDPSFGACRTGSAAQLWP